MSNSGRPLSPHLSIYRWPITMVLSILHRVTGVAMSIGLIVLAAWLMQAAAGPEAYLKFTTLMGTMAGRLLLVGWSFAFFFHAANGIRHLAWDTGRGFDKQSADRSAWLVLAFAVAMNTIFWWIAT
ncbi:MAG TPA: succinate dehydrogenase, cytochrome b556 subunit [Woeseiaceae bacterium]|nr:succinate dehydrogenase, cytochrome b556 subunit [Woeseiaceae bacterium]